MPSIKDLMQEFGIAQGTAERAFQVLKDEGLVRVVIGRGHWVVPPGERPGA
jgi:DNA-binding GntR family transcriptional regulator